MLTQALHSGNTRLPRLLLTAAAVLVQFGLGATGLIGELPADTRPDEAHLFVERAARMVAFGDLNPHQFLFPGGPHIYANAGLFAASFWVSNTGQPFADHFQQQRLYYYVLARLFSLACMCLSAAVIFPLSCLLLKSHTAALLGVWWVALSPLVVAYSSYARNDASTTLLAVLAVYHAARLWSNLRFAPLLASGLCTGLAVGNRYFMAFLIGYIALALLCVHLLRRTTLRSALMSLTIFTGVSLVAFLMSNPFLIVEREIALRDLQVQARTTHLGADGLSPIGNFVWYLTNTLPEGLTLPQTGLAALGFVLALTSRSLRLVWFAALPLCYIGATSLLALHWHRWVLQALPFLSVLAGYGTAWLLQVGLLQRRHPLVRSLSIATAVASLIWAGLQGTAYAAWRSMPTTRQQAGAWMAANLPGGSTIHQQPYGALLPADQFNVEGLRLPVLSPAQLAAQGVNYVVLSSGVYGRHRAEPKRYQNTVRSLDQFQEQAELIKAFYPPRECHIELMVTLCGGPTLLIYKVR